MKLAGSLSPCAPMAAGASRASSVVSPTLIIQMSTASGAPWVRTGFMVSETKISRRPTDTCARTAYSRSGAMLSGSKLMSNSNGGLPGSGTVARPSSVAGASATLTSSSTTSRTAPGGSAISSR